MKTHKVLVLVRYSLVNELPREFLAHEIPILQNLSDGQAIRVTEPEYGPGPDMSARDILISLRKKYGSRTSTTGGNVVDDVYPDGSRDIELFYKGEYRPPILDEDSDVLDDGDDFTPNKHRAIPDKDQPPEQSRDEIIAKLRELEVPFSPNTPTKHLVVLLAASVESEEPA